MRHTLMYLKQTYLMVVLFFLGTANFYCSAQILQGSFESKFKRYDKGENFVGQPIQTQNLIAWKGERLYAQAIIWSSSNQNNISYEISNFTDGINTLNASNITLMFAENVKGDLEARSCGTYPQPRLTTVETAEALSFTPKTTIESTDPIKIWIRFDVPPNSVSGNYSGSIRVNLNGVEQVFFTLNIEILNKHLPTVDNWSFHLDLWQYPYQLLKYYNINHAGSEIDIWSDTHMDMVTQYYELLVDAGQKVITAHIKEGAQGQPSMVKWILKNNGNWEYDFTAFDKWVNKMISLGISKQINCFSPVGWDEVKEFIPYFDEATNTNKKLPAPLASIVFNTRWNHFLTAFKDHLISKGWFDKTVLYLDEIEESLLANIILMIHENDPDWKIGLTFFNDLSQTIKDDLYDISGILGEASSIGRTGKISTFYTSCSQTVPNNYVTPDNSPGEMNWMAWHVINQNLDGYLRWAYDFWTLDDPFDIRNGSHTSGDFSIIYRSSNELSNEVYSSYRLEHLRNGIQDYEKVKILREELETSTDLFSQEALTILNNKINQFSATSGQGANALITEGENILNDIVKGTFSYCKVTGATQSNIYSQWISTAGAVKNLGRWNSSYPGGYMKNPNDNLKINVGSSFSLTIENSLASNCSRTKAWIDWNGDNDFDDDGEEILNNGIANSCSNSLTKTLTINVPIKAKLGKSRLRIQVRASSDEVPTACGMISNASTQDFEIDILDAYCLSKTDYNTSYFVNKLTTNTCINSIDFTSTYAPVNGYQYHTETKATVNKNSSFNIYLKNSNNSGCVRTKIWIDWNNDNDFSDLGEEVYFFGNASSCQNSLEQNIVISVPENAVLGKTRMRVQLRDAYQAFPESCIIDAVTGTSDFDIEIIENNSLECLPIITEPVKEKRFTNSSSLIRWTGNQTTIDSWRLKITSNSFGGGIATHFDQVYNSSILSAQVNTLPNDGRLVTIELFWLSNGAWESIKSSHRSFDVHGIVGGLSNNNYYIQTVNTVGGSSNLNYQILGYHKGGYDYHRATRIITKIGDQFTINLIPSAASRCARLKVWIDWNEDNDFDDLGEEVFNFGKQQSCDNPYDYNFSINVPNSTSVGLKRMRIQLRDAWQPEPVAYGINNFTGTLDFDLEVVSPVKAQLDYYSDFNNNIISWTKQSSNKNGQVGIYQASRYSYPKKVLKLGRRNTIGVDPIVHADLLVDLSTISNDVLLSVNHAAYAHPYVTTPTETGIYLSNNGGQTFVKVSSPFIFDLNFHTTASMLNITQLAAQHNLSLTSNFIIRFQHKPSVAYPDGIELWNIWLVEEKNSGSANQLSLKDVISSKIASDLVLYPNPNNGSFSIRLNNTFAVPGMLSIYIYDLSGKVISHYKHQVIKGKLLVEIDVAGMSSGTYLVKTINTFGDQITKQMVIE